MTPRLPSPLPSISLGALLGMRDDGDHQTWAQIRAAQLIVVRQRALLLLAAQLIAVALAVPSLVSTAARWQIDLWTGAVVVGAVTTTMRRLRVADQSSVGATRRQILNATWDSLGLALAWSAPLVLFAVEHMLPPPAGLWITLSALLLATALTLAPVLLAALVFVVVVVAAIVAALVAAQAHVAAFSATILGGLLSWLTFVLARALVARHLTDAALDERDETVSLLLREFEEHGADWLWETDAARRVVKASPRFAVACGLDPVSINGMAFLQVLAGPAWESGEFAPGLRTLADKLKARDSFRDLRLPVTIDGEERWWELSASPRFDDRGAFCGFRGVGSDVTEQRASADKISRLARFDTLTGLPNRLHINEALARAMSQADHWGSRCAFMLIDLDRFKAVNDTLGHLIGDRLLVRVAERLGQLMDEGTLCGRLGGDEFAVVVADATDTGAVERSAHRIIETLSRPYEVDQHTLHIGASVGLAIGPRDGRTAEMLIRSADLALYRSKDAGGGVFHAYGHGRAFGSG